MRRVRNRFTKTPGVVTRIFFEQYPSHGSHVHCVDITAYGYPPAMLEPLVEVYHGNGHGIMTVHASWFSHYFEDDV